MKSSVEVLSSLERKLNIEVPAVQVQAAFDRAFQNIQKQAAIKGFRKGKAPLTTIRSVFGDRVKEDVIQDLIRESYPAALAEHSLEPISYPAIEFDTISDQADFAFSAEFEVRPAVSLKKLDGLKAQKERLTVPDSVVDETLEDVRKRQAQFIPVMESRPAQNGDVAVLDFEGFLLTGPLENGSAKGHQLELGASSFIPGFEEGVLGMRPDESKEIRISFPDEYHAKELAGKPVTFKVTLHELKKKALPELNDEFAKTMGNYQTMDEVRAAIRKDYESREEQRIQEDLKNRLLRALVEANPVDVPKSLLKEQRETLIQDFKQRLSQQGMDQSTFEQYREKWEQDFTDTAMFMIQTSFLIDAIATQHNLRVTSEEINAKLKDFAATSGAEFKQVHDYYNQGDRRGRLSFQMAEEKVVSFLLEKAKIEEVDRETLQPEPDEGPSL